MAKKLTVTISVILITILLFAGCGSQPDKGTDTTQALSVDSLKTLGDVDALDTENMQTSVTDNKAILAFKHKGSYYRVIASISEKDQQAYVDIDFADDDFEEQQKKILAPLKVEKIENLSEQILTQDELNALAGKTGKDLLSDGWSCTGNYDLESREFFLNYGPFLYSVTFDGEIAQENADDFDEETGIRDLKVKSVEFNSLGDATTIE